MASRSPVGRSAACVVWIHSPPSHNPPLPHSLPPQGDFGDSMNS